jgi:AcrR family transcriptional regulator
MPKKDGYKTRARILDVAEDLFSKKGFNGTSIDMIAKATGVNKGLIYYHFKDKEDIVLSIFQNIINEIGDNVNVKHDDQVETYEGEVQRKIRGEIEYCMKRKQIISVMLMESLKNDTRSDFLFQCAEIVMKNEYDGLKKQIDLNEIKNPDEITRYLVHEFFTGFIPIVTFVTLQDSWCDYFNCSKQKALDYFLESFSHTHLKSNIG